MSYHLIYFSSSLNSHLSMSSDIFFPFLSSNFLLFIFPILSGTEIFSFFSLLYSHFYQRISGSDTIHQKPKFPFHPWKVYQQFPLYTPCLMHLWSGLYTWWSCCIPLDALGKWLWRSGSSVISSSSHLSDFKVFWRKAAPVTWVKATLLHVGLRQFGKAANLTLTFFGKPVD